MDDDGRKPKRRARRRKAEGPDSVAEQDPPRQGGQPGQRRIDAAQFAFLRYVVLGLPLREAADRCQEQGIDLRKAQSELRWLRTELLAAARGAHAYGDARALQLDIAQLPTGQHEKAPSSAPTPRTSESGSIPTASTARPNCSSITRRHTRQRQRPIGEPAELRD